MSGSVVSFNESIVLGMLRVTHLHLNAQARPQTHEGRGKITALWAADPPWIAIDRDGARTAIRLKALDHAGQRRLGREISPHVGIEQDGCADIHHIAGLDHMHLLADLGSAGTVDTSLKSSCQ
jgi:hypothetical protein